MACGRAAVEAQRTRPWLKLLKNDRNRGAAYSAKRAIREASKDYLFWQTMDWAYDISGLAESLPLLQQFDILQGVRVNALTGTAFSLRSDTTLEGPGLTYQLSPGPAAVPVAAQRLPERDRVSAGADPVLRVRDRQFVHESRVAAQGVVVRARRSARLRFRSSSASAVSPRARVGRRSCDRFATFSTGGSCGSCSAGARQIDR